MVTFIQNIKLENLYSQKHKAGSDNENGREFVFLFDMNWNEYDKILGEVVKSVIITHPVQVIKLTFIKVIRFISLYYIYCNNTQILRIVDKTI